MVIKCPTGLWRGLPRLGAMQMSTAGGQGCLINACWTIWLKRRSTGGLMSLQISNSSPEEEGNSINWDTLDQDHLPSVFHYPSLLDLFTPTIFLSSCMSPLITFRLLGMKILYIYIK